MDTPRTGRAGSTRCDSGKPCKADLCAPQHTNRSQRRPPYTKLYIHPLHTHTQQVTSERAASTLLWSRSTQEWNCRGKTHPQDRACISGTESGSNPLDRCRIRRVRLHQGGCWYHRVRSDKVHRQPCQYCRNSPQDIRIAHPATGHELRDIQTDRQEWMRHLRV